MSGRIIRRVQARRDAIESALYIAQDNPEAGRRLLDAIESAYKQLAVMPQMGTAYASRNPALAGLRRLPVPGFHNFQIFYRPIDAGIEVIRVLHGARDYDSLFGNSATGVGL